MNDRIRAIVGRVGRLSVPLAILRDDSDLHDAGLTSFGTVELMLSIEEEFGIEFPEDLITRARFSSIAAIGDTVRLIAERPGGIGAVHHPVMQLLIEAGGRDPLLADRRGD